MNETKNNSVKALKKQMAAAVAMVCVAAVALGSSTYAWFVSNNTVTAKTASISAQSNAPFLVISNDAITKTSTKTEETTTVADKTLYPVQMVAANDDATVFTWQSAYASASDTSTEKATTRFTVQDADKENYYVKQTFHIGTNGTTKGQFKNLRVSGVTVTPGQTDDELKNAIRVMVVCGAEIAIYDQSGTLVTTYNNSTTTTASNQAITGLTAAEDRQANGTTTNAAYLTTANDVFPTTAGEIGDKTVDVYVYYDGAVANVRTDNLDKLGSVKATVSFTADDAAAPTANN